jgi:hypothetical protein
MVDHLKSLKAKGLQPQQPQHQQQQQVIQHLHVVAHGFNPIPTYQKLLQEAASAGIHVKFCCMADPTAPIDDASVAQFLASLSAHENASCCRFECDAASISQMLLEWTTRAFNTQGFNQLQLTMPREVAGKSSFLCSCSQLVQRVKTTAEGSSNCPCHQLSVRSTGHTDSTQQTCSITGCSVASNACSADRRALQLGHHTTLRLSTFSTAFPGLQHSAATAAVNSSLSTPALQVISTVRLQDINQSLVHGMPHLLGGLPDLESATCTSPTNSSSDEEVFAALTASLAQDSKALLASSLVDLDSTGTTGFLKTMYILQPTGTPGYLLCCKIAAAEQLLPVPSMEQAAVPKPELVQQISTSVDAWDQVGMHAGVFDPTRIEAGYHDAINQLVKDSVKLVPVAAKPPPATRPAASSVQQVPPTASSIPRSAAQPLAKPAQSTRAPEAAPTAASAAGRNRALSTRRPPSSGGLPARTARLNLQTVQQPKK